jgi:hypothetical protein
LKFFSLARIEQEEREVFFVVVITGCTKLHFSLLSIGALLLLIVVSLDLFGLFYFSPSV